MDEALKWFVGPFFNGQLPTTLKQIPQRLQWCLKFSSPTFAAKHRGGIPNFDAIMKKIGKILSPTEFSTYLKSYLEGSESAEKLLFNVHHLLNKGGRSGINNFVPSDLLTQLRDSLPRELARLNIDLVALSNNCDNSMGSIRQEFESRPGIAGLERYVDANSPQHQNALIMFDIMYAGHFQALVAEQTFRQSRKSGRNAVQESEGESKFSVAVDPLQKFLSEANLNFSIKVEPFDIVADTKVSYLEAFQAAMPKKAGKIMSTVDRFAGQIPERTHGLPSAGMQ